MLKHRNKKEKAEEWAVSGTRDVDSGWAWVVVLVSFITHSMTLGFAYGMGVYYVEFLQAFRESKAKTAWITSLNFCLLCGTGPLASLMVQRFGCRTTLAMGGLLSTIGLSAGALAIDVNTLLLTMGLIAGLGFGFCHVPIVVVITHYFCKYGTLAQGLAFSGAGVGTIVYPWICRALINTFSWRGALIICAAINFHIVALAMLIPNTSPLQRALKARAQESECESKGVALGSKNEVHKIKSFMHYFKLFKNINFTLLCFNNFFVQFGMYIVYTHLPAYALSLNFGQMKADLLISVVGVFNLLGRAGLGLIGQHERVDVPQLYVASFIFAGLSIMVCGFITKFVVVAICSSIFGFLCGATGPLLVEFACVIIGLDNFNRGYGFITVFMALGNLLGAPSAGLVYDLTKFYPASIYLGGVCILVCAFILIPTVISMIKSRKRRKAMAMIPINEEEITIT